MFKIFCTCFMYVLNICLFSNYEFHCVSIPNECWAKNCILKSPKCTDFYFSVEIIFILLINQYYTVLIYLFLSRGLIDCCIFNKFDRCEIVSVETSRLNLSEQLPTKVTVTWATRKWKPGFCWRGREKLWVCLMVGLCLMLSTTNQTRKRFKYSVDSGSNRSDGLNRQFNWYRNVMAGPNFQVSIKLRGCVLM